MCEVLCVIVYFTKIFFEYAYASDASFEEYYIIEVTLILLQLLYPGFLCDMFLFRNSNRSTLIMLSNQ